MREYPLTESEKIKVHGRTIARRDPAMLLWTGSSIELNVRCSELYVELAGPYTEHESWIAVEINGEILARQMVRREREWICIFRNKLADKVTNVRIIKTVQAMNADPEHCIEVYAVRLDGELLPVKDRALKIEYIGDSVTSGEGAIGAREEEEWISLFFAHERSYPYMVSKALDADYRVISQSGWGVYSSWDNQTRYAIPPYYRQICGVVPPERFQPLGFYEENDFAAWQPDVICVNLGTNDDGAFHNPAYIDPQTGRTQKLHMLDETTYAPEDLAKVEGAVTEFLRTLRDCNPGAYLLWCFGILGDGLRPAIEAGIARYRETTGDARVEYLPIPNTTEETIGARLHPGEAAHRRAAEVIIARIRTLR